MNPTDDVAVEEGRGPVRLCASCGAPLSPGLRFCASCGNWIGSDDPVVEEAAVVEAPVEEAEPVEREHPVREVPALVVHEPPVGDMAMTEVHAMPVSAHVEDRPIVFAREPLSRMRRVLLAIALL